jgi:hypothetical protein
VNQAARARAFSGWFVRGVVKNRLVTPRTRLRLDEEYWLALRHPSEVAAVGLAQLASTHPGFASLPGEDQQRLWREFRAYVRQAEGFYRGAEVLPWRSSPLNYYYSFMNLAKAIALSRGLFPALPVDAPRHLRHGLSASVESGLSDKWKLTIKSAGDIFGLLYQASVGTSAPAGTTMDARELLGYVSSIHWQVEQSRPTEAASWFPCKWVILVDGKRFWDVVAVPRVANMSKLSPALGTLYEELPVEAAKDLARSTMDLQAVQAASFRFLQRTTPLEAEDPAKVNVRPIEDSLCAAIPNCVFEHLDGTEFQLCIGVPYEAAEGPMAMNELAASYAVMYFLSSAVRYHPDYMERLGESTDSWLIESFTKSVPLTLLRQMIAALLGYTLIIEPA